MTVLDPRRAPAAIGTVKSGMFAKSVPAVAPSPVTVTAAWVSEVSSDEAAWGNSTARVMDVGPSSSATEVLSRPSRNRESWSRMVMAAGLTTKPGSDEDRDTVSGPSSTVSEAAVKLKVAVPLFWFCGMTTVTLAGAV